MNLACQSQQLSIRSIDDVLCAGSWGEETQITIFQDEGAAL
jgi:hypothetical protein